MQFPRERLALYAVLTILFLIFVAGLVGYGITPKSIYEVLVLKPVSLIIDFFNNTYSSVQNYFISIVKGKALIIENQNLRDYISTLESRLKILLGYYYENIELKNLLGIKHNIKFNTIGCNIILYSKSGNFLVIDRGKDSNLKIDMPVVYSVDGVTSFLVGKITEVSNNTSKVTLETSPNFKVGVKNASRGGIDVASGNGNGLTVVRPSQDVSDSLSDIFVTVEESGIFPKDIVVGKVSKIKKISAVENEIELEPLIDFYTIRNVLVITSYEKN
ncbi:putative rod shape-determining protein MreC [Caldisericum exile AZM16c01]|uniref:Cell shape-determining protein MreC n=2 Tax=Caldisericum exile TaxID=693075 RepID=A0A7U6GES7_CALEA|nr:putative rod shape-determining protein MreC [Caldisericum exile AZM16c01]